jgi:hypothetical protein
MAAYIASQVVRKRVTFLMRLSLVTPVGFQRGRHWYLVVGVVAVPFPLESGAIRHGH